MSTELLDQEDGLGIAAAIRRGDVTATEMLEAAIARIEARNPALNAVVHKAYDDARARLSRIPAGAAFAGVPFLVKDLFSFCEGMPCENGSRLWRGFVAPEDMELVRRFRRAGLVIAGRTATSEFGLSIATETTLCGPTRNPWNRDRTPGGSSGGAAAAVAAGMVPLAHASDGGGSIRIPASCCGLYGLKPGRGRMPLPEAWGGLATALGVSRSVRDSAALLDATHGPLPGMATVARPPRRPYLAEVGADPGRLRVALCLDRWSGAPLDPEVESAVRETARLLESLGHHVDEAGPPLDRDALFEAGLVVVCSHVATDFAAGHPMTGEQPSPATVEAPGLYLAAIGARQSASDYLRALGQLRAAGDALGAFFRQHDILLTPTLTRPPLPIGTLSPETLPEEALRIHREWFPYTPILNQTGNPAASLPLAWSADGLPIGVQIAGRHGEEDLLIRLSAQLEAAKPWWDRRPELV